VAAVRTFFCGLERGRFRILVDNLLAGGANLIKRPWRLNLKNIVPNQLFEYFSGELWRAEHLGNDAL
jgi:hypothetical protein